ncbi:MAG TPA: hypothetical protein VF288_05435 [Mycobacteriales bacterium]
MDDLLRPDLRPLTLWLVVRRPDDAVLWVEADRRVLAGPHVELVIDVVFLGRRRVVVEQRLPAGDVLVCERLAVRVPWRPHRW